MFSFTGALESSKSWMNRALIIQIYQPLLKIVGHSGSEDVKNLQQSLKDFSNGKREFFLGAGGTSLRFFTFLVSRHPGVWTLNADKRLLQRPQFGLKKILQQLGVTVIAESDTRISIQSKGWEIPQSILCDGQISSQFVSGLLLNCWNLPREIKINIQKPIVSVEYLNMTLALLQEFGLEISRTEKVDFIELIVAANQLPQVKHISAEPDISSAFALASAAVINGHANILNWPRVSLQPDLIFLDIFKKMNISFELVENRLSVQKQTVWSATDQDLKSTPDLFPVLAVLCSLADGVSYLYGAENLHAKESDRFAKTIELLSLCGFKTDVKDNGLVIYGKSSSQDKSVALAFDPDQDHRMAMAAGLFWLAGFNIDILNPSVVDKSYAQFWHHIQDIS